MQGGGRPGTPEFNLEGELSDDENDKEQKDQIRARMEAQIQGFDDDNWKDVYPTSSFEQFSYHCAMNHSLSLVFCVALKARLL